MGVHVLHIIHITSFQIYCVTPLPLRNYPLEMLSKRCYALSIMFGEGTSVLQSSLHCIDVVCLYELIPFEGTAFSQIMLKHH